MLCYASQVGSERKPGTKGRRLQRGLFFIAVGLLTVLYVVSDDRTLIGAWITMAPPLCGSSSCCRRHTVEVEGSDHRAVVAELALGASP